MDPRDDLTKGKPGGSRWLVKWLLVLALAGAVVALLLLLVPERAVAVEHASPRSSGLARGAPLVARPAPAGTDLARALRTRAPAPTR